MQKVISSWIRRKCDDSPGHFKGTSHLDTIRRLSLILHKSKIEELIQEENQGQDKISGCKPVSLSWLHNVAPGFALDGSKISVIYEPSKFYELLLERCATAKRRITLASLYLGTGKLEEKLVSMIHHNLDRSAGKLKVKVLLDYMRGSRGSLNSRQMLLPLLQQHHQSCQVSLYHTPALRGPMRTLVPSRYNELIGLQHMKLYLFDDSLLISGANLSNDYFTNRQDRYFLIEDCQPLADFYDDLVSRVCEFSLQLDKKDEVHLHAGWTLYPFKGNQEEFTTAAHKHVWDYYMAAVKKQHSLANKCISSTADTWIFPLIEMGQLGIHQDSVVTAHLLETATPHSKIHLATGYFNLTQLYMDTIIHRSPANYSILMAHPNANGFMGAKGPAGGIPAAYTELAAKFFLNLQSAGQVERIKMLEYQKSGWTFHAKGMWYMLPGFKQPTLTLIGSPNFGSRSVHRDLETQIAVVTSNPQLQAELAEEQQRLFNKGSLFTDQTFTAVERLTPLWVHAIVWLCQNFF